MDQEILPLLFSEYYGGMELLVASRFIKQTSRGTIVDEVELGVTKASLVHLEFLKECITCGKKETLTLGNCREHQPCILITICPLENVIIEMKEHRVLSVTFPVRLYPNFYQLTKHPESRRVWKKWKSLLPEQGLPSYQDTDVMEHTIIHSKDVKLHILSHLPSYFAQDIVSDEPLEPIPEESFPFDTSRLQGLTSALSKEAKCDTRKEKDSIVKYAKVLQNSISPKGQTTTSKKHSPVRNKVTDNGKVLRIRRTINRFGAGIADNCVIPLTMSSDDTKETQFLESISASPNATDASEDVSDEKEGFFDPMILHKVISKSVARANRPMPRAFPLRKKKKKKRTLPNEEESQLRRKWEDLLYDDGLSGKEITVEKEIPWIHNVSFSHEVTVATSLWLKVDHSSLSHLRRCNSCPTSLKMKETSLVMIQRIKSLDNLNVLAINRNDICHPPEGSSNELPSLKRDPVTLSFWMPFSGSKEHPKKLRILRPRLESESDLEIKIQSEPLITRSFSKDDKLHYHISEQSIRSKSSKHISLTLHEHLLKDQISSRTYEEREKFSSSSDATEHRSRMVYFHNIMPCDVAREIASAISRLFSSLQPSEVMHYIKSPHTATLEKCPQLFRIVAFFVRLALLVTTCVLDHENPDDRAEVISFFVDVANHGFQIHDLQGGCAVLSGLRSYHILRLKQTSKIFQQHYPHHYSHVNSLVSTYFVEEHHCEKDSHSPAEIPFLGSFLNNLRDNQRKITRPTAKKKKVHSKRKLNGSTVLTWLENDGQKNAGNHHKPCATQDPQESSRKPYAPLTYDLRKKFYSTFCSMFCKRRSVKTRRRARHRKISMLSRNKPSKHTALNELNGTYPSWDYNIEDKFKTLRKTNISDWTTPVSDNALQFVLFAPYNSDMLNLHISLQLEPPACKY